MRMWKVATAAAGSLVLVVALGSTTSAQSIVGNPALLQVLLDLQATLNGLVSAVGSVASTVQTISTNTTPGNVLFTPTMVAFSPDTFICSATNVTSESRSLNVQLLNGNTGAVLSQTSVTVSAGLTTSTSQGAGAGGLRAYCKITVANGVKTDVRGVMSLFSAATAPDRDPVVAQ